MVGKGGEVGVMTFLNANIDNYFNNYQLKLINKSTFEFFHKHEPFIKFMEFH